MDWFFQSEKRRIDRYTYMHTHTYSVYTYICLICDKNKVTVHSGIRLRLFTGDINFITNNEVASKLQQVGYSRHMKHFPAVCTGLTFQYVLVVQWDNDVAQNKPSLSPCIQKYCGVRHLAC